MLGRDFVNRLVSSVEAHEKKAYRGLEPGVVCTPRCNDKDAISDCLREALKIPFETVRVTSVNPAPAWDLTGRDEVTFVTGDGLERKLSRSTFTACFSVELPTRYDHILEGADP